MDDIDEERLKVMIYVYFKLSIISFAFVNEFSNAVDNNIEAFVK